MNIKKIGRRIFYDKRNGEVLAVVGERIGHVRPTTVEEDIESFPKLQERNPDTFACIDLEFGEYKQDFREGKLVAVDPVTKEFKFVYHEDETQTPRPPLSKEVESLKRSTLTTMMALAEKDNDIHKLEKSNLRTMLAIAELNAELHRLKE